MSLKTGYLDTRTATQRLQVSGGKYLLLGRVVGKVDALLNVGLEALDSLAQELLLLLGDALQRVGGLLHTFGLRKGSAKHASSAMEEKICQKLTPSSTGTEKKSTPVALAMASPPGTPGR